MALAMEIPVATLTARQMVTLTATTTETMTVTGLGWRMGTATIAPVPTRGWATGFRAGWAGSGWQPRTAGKGRARSPRAPLGPLADRRRSSDERPCSEPSRDTRVAEA